MRENRTSGTEWGVLGNRHSYHDVRQAQPGASYRVPCPVTRQEVLIGQSLTSSPYRVLRDSRSRQYGEQQS